MNNNMKKIFYLLLSSLLMISLYSCSSDDDETEPQGSGAKVKITATMKCKADNNYVPDVGASLYIFQDFTDYVNYEYKNGTYVHKTSGSVVKHTQKAIAGSDGVASLEVNGGQHSLVVWESAKYQGKYGQNVYEIKKGNKPINISDINFAP